MYIRAEEYCKRVFDGTHDSPKPKDEGRLLITSKNILNQELNFKDAYLISPEEFDKVNKRSQIHQWDILFSMIGTVGSIYLERNSEINYCIKNMGVFSCGDKDKAEWLYYYLQSDEVKKRINAFMSGAVQKFVPLQFLRNLPVPEYDESKRNVAIVLSSIDKRIENLRAQNRVLEQTAKTIYDYTFLQCAGHQTTYNKTLNRNIPVDWEVKKLGDLCSIFTGKKDVSKRIPGDYAFFSCAPEKLSSNEYLYDGQAILVSGNGSYTGRVSYYDGKFDLYQRTYACVLKNTSASVMPYLYFTMKYLFEPAYSGGTHGSAIPYIVMNDLTNYSICWNSPAIESFVQRVSPMFKKRLINLKQIEALITQRNTLLPLLMTGQVNF